MNPFEKPRPDWFLPPSETDKSLAPTAGPAETGHELPPGLKKVEHKNGLPVLDETDYFRLYNTDIRALGETSAATFNYRGYVRSPEGGGRTIDSYRDALATNGILKAEGHKGVHVGTDGIVDYHALDRNHRMTGPQDVGEYDVYVIVPGAIQKEQGVVVDSDSCRSQADYLEYHDREDLDQHYARGGDGDYIVMRLNLEPKNDPLARRKAEVIHHTIVSYIESGQPLDGLMETVRDMEDRLEGITPEDLERAALEKPAPELKP